MRKLLHPEIADVERMFEDGPINHTFIIYPRGHAKPTVDRASPTIKLLGLPSSVYHITEGGKKGVQNNFHGTLWWSTFRVKCQRTFKT